MELYTYGVVIREYPMRERDKLLILLTPDMGKISVWANNVKSLKSQNLAISQTLAYSRFKLKESDGKYSLMSGRAENIFFPLRESIEKLALAQYFCEFLDRAVIDDSEAKNIMSLMLNSLYLLCRDDANVRMIKAAFELKLMSYIGFSPRVSSCISCGAIDESMCFDLSAGGLLCNSCKSHTQKETSALYPINQAVQKALNHIISAEPKRIFSFRLDADSEDILSKVCEGFMLSQLGVSFKTLEFYNSL